MIDYDLMIDFLLNEDITNHKIGLIQLQSLSDEELWTFFQDYAPTMEGLMEYAYQHPKHFLNRGRHTEMEEVKIPVIWTYAFPIQNHSYMGFLSIIYKAQVFGFNVRKSEIRFYFYDGEPNIYDFNLGKHMFTIKARRFGHSHLMFQEPRWEPKHQVVVNKGESFKQFKQHLENTLKLLS
jgi:hypothetical protein